MRDKLSIILNSNRWMNIFLKEIQPAILCWGNSAFLMILMQYYLIIPILTEIKPNLAPQGHYISSLWQDKFPTHVTFQKNLKYSTRDCPIKSSKKLLNCHRWVQISILTPIIESTDTWDIAIPHIQIPILSSVHIWLLKHQYKVCQPQGRMKMGAHTAINFFLYATTSGRKSVK